MRGSRTLCCLLPALVMGCIACVGAVRAQQVVVDRAVAKVDQDVILLSDLRELGQFQQLIEGQAEPEKKRLDELIDQHIIEQEANAAGFKAPTADEIAAAEKKLADEAGGEEKFKQREQETGLTESAVQRQLGRALYFSRYMDYKFRPAAQITDETIQKYYDNDFVKQAQARGQTAPPLSEVKEQIRELLVEEDITARSNQWLDESRAHEKIQIMLTTEPNSSGAQS